MWLGVTVAALGLQSFSGLPTSVNMTACFVNNTRLPAQPSLSMPLQLFLPAGNSSLRYTVTDSNQLSATCRATIVVRDDQAPSITCASVNISAVGGVPYFTYRNAMILNASDNAGPVRTRCDISTPYNFPLGPSTVLCQVWDAVNLTASCNFTITVYDNVPPTILCPGSTSVSTQGSQGNQPFAARPRAFRSRPHT